MGEKKPTHTRVILSEKCPQCGSALTPKIALLTDWPYIHCDVQLDCSSCEFKALYGIPLDPLAGVSLQIYDSNPAEVFERIRIAKLDGSGSLPVCPFHKTEMKMTKVFGNKVFKDGTVRIQFKCPKCFVTEHVNIER